MRDTLGPLAAIALGLAMAIIRVKVVRAIMEPEGINWARDWDALLLGYVIGTLGTLALQVVL